MDVELWKKNFFYGMDAKSEVIEYIILKKAKEMEKVDMSKIDTNLYKVEYTLQQISRLVVQLYRFVYMNEPKEKQTYFYQKITEDSIEIEQLVQDKITELKNKDIIVGAIKNFPMTAIWITGGPNHSMYPGKEYYNQFMQSEKGQWIKNEIIPILEQLCTLETENKEQYYALFLDVKYNRAINAQEQLKSEQEYLENLQEQEESKIRIEQIQKIRAALPKQIKEIRNVFTRFMNAVKLPKQDIIAGLGNNLSDEMHQQIEQNFSNYETISPLKQEAIDSKYQERLNKKIQEIKSKILEEETR